MKKVNVKQLLEKLEAIIDDFRFRFSNEETKEKMLYEASVQALRREGYVRTKKNDGWIKYNG